MNVSQVSRRDVGRWHTEDLRHAVVYMYDDLPRYWNNNRGPGPDDALAVTIVVLRLRGGVFGCVVESTQVPLEGD